jgi:tRNA-dihydrouridine synthase A
MLPVKTATVPKVSVAPMMAVTDRHCRYFLRQLAPAVRLYTEMVTSQAILRGEHGRLLGFDPAEHPVAAQLGGHDPSELAEAARIAAGYGYDEINLNVGCPSGKVHNGGFGACLMMDAARVARCVAAMRAAVTVPVTVKTRVGVDDHDSYGFFADFIGTVAAAGCDTFIVHARKAILRGLSPRDNLVIPPLRHATVYRLKADFPRLDVIINGGIRTLDEIDTHLGHVDGVMLGRKVAEDPFFLTQVQARFFGRAGGSAMPDRAAVVRRMYDYACRQSRAAVSLRHVARHMLALYHGVPGARMWRRSLSERASRDDATPDALIQCLAALEFAAKA